MIRLYIISLIVGVASFILLGIVARKLKLSVRMGIALGIFIVLSLAATVWLLSVGDKPLPGAIVVYPEKAVGVPSETK